jgi:oligopeptidase A
MNPLLDFSGLPRFEDITPDHVVPGVSSLLAENRRLFSRLSEPPTPATWEDFVAPLVDASERVSRAWGVVSHLHSVHDVPAWRQAYNDALPDITRYGIEQAQNPALLSKYQAIKDSPAFLSLSPPRQRIIEHELRDYRLAGAQLPPEEQSRFKAIQEELATLGAQFAQNLQDATRHHAEWVDDPQECAGIPPDVLAAAQAGAQQAQRGGWKFTLHAPVYIPVMQYAENRDLRARMYRAYATRASEFGPPERDNGPLLTRFAQLRQEAARLLGYHCYAEVSLESKMAQSCAQVSQFLRELAQRARPVAQREWSQLQDFAGARLGLRDLEAWDIAWASEKLKQECYAFSDDQLRQYFPEHRVLDGLFGIIETLFGVRIEPDHGPTWHPDVRFFRLQRGAHCIGHFYLDLYARDGKRGGAWMDEARSRRSGGQTPVAYLNCNFAAPVGGRPSTLTHDDVLTLFHEMGHGLHHLLTEMDDLWVSGIHGVEWDAVELPSQFLENFAWEWEVLSRMTGHVDTGEPLPRALYDQMIAAKNFQGGLSLLRQIEFALFDLRLHSDFKAQDADPAGKHVMALLDEVRAEICVIRPPPWNRFAQSFSHIFDGGYAAGYYSYKWAEVLSADAYAAFEEAAITHGSVLDPSTGERFAQEILATGGGRPALASFKAFRRREPQPDALLRHNGLI